MPTVSIVCFFLATASYRLLPEITLLKPITGDLTERLIKCFSKGVIKTKTKNGTSLFHRV